MPGRRSACLLIEKQFGCLSRARLRSFLSGQSREPDKWGGRATASFDWMHVVLRVGEMRTISGKMPGQGEPMLPMFPDRFLQVRHGLGRGACNPSTGSFETARRRRGIFQWASPNHAKPFSNWADRERRESMRPSGENRPSSANLSENHLWENDFPGIASDATKVLLFAVGFETTNDGANMAFK